MLTCIVNKDKGIFKVGTKSLPSMNTLDRKNATNLFKHVQDTLLSNKERVQKEMLIKSIEPNYVKPQSYSIDDNDDMDDEDAYEDEDKDLKLLQTNIFTLTVSSSNQRSIADFEEQLELNYRTFSFRSVVTLLIIHLIQTLILLVIYEETQEKVDSIIALFMLRLLFALFLLLRLVLNKNLSKNGNCAYKHCFNKLNSPINFPVSQRTMN